MKKIVSFLLVLSSLIYLGLGIAADDSNSMDIKDRLNKPNLNILDDQAIIFTNEAGEVLDNPTIDSRVFVKFTWSLLDEDAIRIEPGDTYTFTLPDAFKINTDITNISLGDYGTAVVRKDKTVTFTFSDQVKEHSEVNGYIQFNARLDETEIGGPGEQIIELPLNVSKTFNFTVVPSNAITSIEKDGKVNRNLNPTHITWEVKVNKTYENLKNVKVTDLIPDGLTFESVEVYPLNLNFDGTFKSYGDALTPDEYSVEGTTVTLGDINQPYAVRYITRINDTSKPNDGGKIGFTNNAVMTSAGNEDLPTAGTISAEYGSLLLKERTGYNQDTQTFTWTVKYNFGEKRIVNPLLKDVFSDALEYVDNSLVLLDKDGKAVTYDHTVVNNPSNTLNIQFNEVVEGAVLIRYQTRVKEGQLITENTTFNNTITTEGKSSGGTGTAVPRLIVKSTPSIDYTNHRIAWRINININKYALSEYSVTDVYEYRGLYLDESTMVVTDVTKNKVVLPEFYDVVKTYDNGVETGFKLVFKGEYEKTSSQLRVDFVTDYDINDLEAGRTVFRNKAILDWTDSEGNEHSHSSYVDRPVNTQTLKNGEKLGSYNAVTKEITWKVAVNYNNETYASTSSVSDVIKSGQVFQNESLRIYSYTVRANGDKNISATPENLEDFTIQYPSGDNGYTLKIDFPENTKYQYLIEFKTSLQDQVIVDKYVNTAVYRYGDKQSNLDATVSVTNGNKLVSKNGAQDGSLIHWSVAINESQSTIRNAKLLDLPTSNQIILEDTFKVYPVIMKVDGTYTVDRANPLIAGTDYAVTLETHESGIPMFSVLFKFEMKHAYVLEYDTQISTTPNNTTISNIVTLEGTEIKYTPGGDEKAIVIDVNQAGGGAVGVKGSLTVKKVSDANEPLKDVEFELISPLNRKLATVKTDESGMITFNNLVYGNYKLIEKSTQQGYVIDSELINGKTVVVNAASSDPTNFVEIVNRKNVLTISKVNEVGGLLDGAIFKLERIDGTAVTVIEEAFEIADGSVTRNGLLPGNYRLTEVSAPQGYLQNLEPLNFVIGVNEYNQALDTSVSITNYLGSVRLVKTDAERIALKDVIFDLYTEDGTKIQENLVTDDAGEIVVEALSPGNYYFIETQSSGGNILNENPIHFTIATASIGKPAEVKVTTTNGKGSVTFDKIDTQGTGLPSVGFKLYKVEEELVEIADVVSDTNGIVRVDHLSPGTYYFEETSPLPGYINNSSKHEFVIPETTQDDVVLVALDDFVNSQGNINIIKVDDAGTRLDGAIFTVVDSLGTLVGEYTTENGVIAIEILAPGTYTIKELKAPIGYVIDTEPHEVVIPDTYEGIFETVVVEVVNVKQSIRLPNAGLENSSRMLISLATIALGLLTIHLSKVRKED